MTVKWTQRLLLIASMLTLAAIGLMVWSLLDPRPVPVMLAMSGGQALGTLSLAIYGLVIAMDLRRAKVLTPEPPEPEPEPPPPADEAV